MQVFSSLLRLSLLARVLRRQLTLRRSGTALASRRKSSLHPFSPGFRRLSRSTLRLRVLRKNSDWFIRLPLTDTLCAIEHRFRRSSVQPCGIDELLQPELRPTSGTWSTFADSSSFANRSPFHLAFSLLIHSSLIEIYQNYASKTTKRFVFAIKLLKRDETKRRFRGVQFTYHSPGRVLFRGETELSSDW